MSSKRRHHEEHENHERWLVSYADFITLLFAFFVVLYATSQADLEKREEFQESIKHHLMGFGMGVGQGVGQGGVAADGAGEGQMARLFNPLRTDVFPPRGAGPAEVRDYIERKLDQGMSENSGETIAEIRHETLGVRIQLAANKLFPSGSADLLASSAGALDALGQLLKESNRKLVIEGHTDSEPIRTELYPSNWELSAARATKVVRYLIARHQIPASRFTAIAYADQKPVAPNTTEENRARNRRIDILIVAE